MQTRIHAGSDAQLGMVEERVVLSHVCAVRTSQLERVVRPVRSLKEEATIACSRRPRWGPPRPELVSMTGSSAETRPIVRFYAASKPKPVFGARFCFTTAAVATPSACALQRSLSATELARDSSIASARAIFRYVRIQIRPRVTIYMALLYVLLGLGLASLLEWLRYGHCSYACAEIATLRGCESVNAKHYWLERRSDRWGPSGGRTMEMEPGERHFPP